ncbi:MAG: DUF1214 domain-containing protein [Pseudomonadales bacterium]
MKNQDAVEQVMSGQAWDDFCDGLKAAGKIVQSQAAPDDAFTRAEGYRYLTRLLRAGLESALEFNDVDFPVLRCGCHETIKMGADNPDNHYQSARINPEHDYLVVGDRATVDYLGFSTVINRYNSTGTMETSGFIEASDMDIGPDGKIELILSQTEQPGNWLPMTAESNMLNVRQTFQDRVNEKPAEISIKRLGAEQSRPAPMTPLKLTRGLDGALRSVTGIAQMFEDWSESFLPHMNELPAADQAYCQRIGGDPNIFYFHSAWELADDEVMIIEAAEIPQCQTWNFQLDNWWMESLDYRYHQIHVNKHTAHYEPDGSVKLIVSHDDPGHPNWIETAGHHVGTMCWRWIRADNHPLVSCRVVKRSEI